MIMKNKNSRKKGAAIELAIIAMVIIFGLSALLLNITMISNNVKQNALDDLTEKATLAQIVYTENAEDIPEGYSVQSDGDKIFVYHDEELKLTVTIADGKITDWQYSL